MIVGLVKPNEGKVEFRGQDLTKMPVFMRARRGLGYLAQEASIFRKLSVWDNVMAILEALKITRKDRKARCEELLATFDLMKVAKQPAYTLSGGERRKLEIARALVRKPAILILDDSASALDYATDAALRMAIRTMDNPPTTFIVSQRAASVRYADQILVLDDGCLVGKGTHEELLDTCEVYQEIYYSQFPREVASHG
jgi:ABC-type lipopolysaccharide export system ATPase subunit